MYFLDLKNVKDKVVFFLRSKVLEFVDVDYKKYIIFFKINERV